MQACLPRSYLTPVRDEEAESQRKARSRQARQTRRSTQGVTLSDLKEAQRSFGQAGASEPQRLTYPPSVEKRADKQEEGAEVRVGQNLTRELQESRPRWSREVDEIGNLRPKLETQAENPTTSLTSPSATGFEPCPSSSLTNRRCSRGLDPNGNEWRDERQSEDDSPSKLVLALRERRQARSQSRSAIDSYWTHDTDRTSRLDLGSGSTDSATALGRTSSYTRRENRLASLKKSEQEDGAKDFKKMYEDALVENEKLKSKLENSKQELAKIRTQLEKVTQKQDRITERSSVLETQKREKRVLERKVSDMEEDLKALPQLAQLQALRQGNQRLLVENRAMVLTELKSDNQRLKDENGALIRVISKLSK